MPLDGNGVATATTAALAVGSHGFTAIYSGDGTYNSSASLLTQTVGLAQSSVNLASSANPSLSGQSVTLTATVSGNNGTPTGCMTFLAGSTVLAVVPLDADGVATFSPSSLGLGSSDIVAIYSGDNTYAGNATWLSQAVVQASSTLSLSSSANPSPSGQAVTFTATVAASGSGAPTPTGSVSLFDGATFLGNASLSVVNGQVQATFTTSALGVGTQNIFAIYSGDDTFAESEASLEQTITS